MSAKQRAGFLGLIDPLGPPRKEPILLFAPVIPPPVLQYVPGHDRWHPDIPPVAEVIAGGSIRMRCQGGSRQADESGIPSVPNDGHQIVLCGPVAVFGADPGDLLTAEVIGIGRDDGRYAGSAYPGVIGCAPSREMLAASVNSGSDTRADALLGRVPSTTGEYNRIAAEGIPVRAGDCAFAGLTVRAQVLLPVHVSGARLSVGDLRFPEGPGDGWIDLRLHLTKRGMERFGIREPLVMPLTTSTLDSTLAGLVPVV